MSSEFNPYQQWLNIPAADLPLDYYRLLGVSRFETDLGVIEQAARQQVERVEPHAAGPTAEVAKRVLGEIAAARTCLTTADKKQVYDAKLKAKLEGTSPPSAIRKAMPVAKPLPSPAAPVAIATAAAPVVSAAAPQPVFAPAVTSAAPRGASPKSKAASGTMLPVVLGAGAVFAIAAIGGVIYFATGSPAGKPVAQGTKPKVNSPKQNPAPAAATKPAESENRKPTIATQSVNPAPAVAEPAPPPEPAPANPEPMPTVNPAPVVEPPPAVAQPAPSETPPPTVPEKPLETAVAAETRLPVPTEVELAKADKEIRDVFADALAAAKKPDERQAIARDLIQQGNDPNNSPAIRFAAWKLARTLTLEAGKVDETLSQIDAAGKLFAIAVVAEKVAVLTAAADDASIRASALAASRREFDSLLQADAYPEATEMGRTALQIARLAKDKAAIDQITATALELRSRQSAQQEYLAAMQRLKENDGDAGANLKVGRWLWFMKGQVADGLQHLSLGNDVALAAAASADLAEPADPKQQGAMGDQWRAIADKELGNARLTLLKRAQHWYQRALPAAAGLDKLRIEKQLAELSSEIPNPAQLASGSSPSADPVKKPTPPMATPNERPAVEWKIPKANANTAFKCFLGFYMYQEDRGKSYPVVNLRIPNGDLWSKEIQDKCRGRISFDEISYNGTASFVIPADGVYILTMADGKATINGKPTGGEGELSMVKGIHSFFFSVGSHGQPHINKAKIALRHKETGAEVVFFNTWRDIQHFLATPIAGQRVLDVSDWKPTEHDEVRVDPKALTVTNPNFK